MYITSCKFIFPLCVVSVVGYGGWIAALLFIYIVVYAMMIINTFTDMLYALVCVIAILSVGVVLYFILLADTEKAKKPGERILHRSP